MNKPVLKRTATEKKKFAKALRDNPSPPEKILLKELKKRKIKFKFQPVICGFIPDFLFGTKIVEVDGKTHLYTKSYDKFRDNILKSNGYSIIRIYASVIMHDLEYAMKIIEAYLAGKRLPKRD